MNLQNYLIYIVTLLSLHFASAATFEVTSIVDSGPGTLRDALAMAADGDTINACKIHGTMWLTNGELFIGKSVVVVGPGPEKLAVDGNSLGRVFPLSRVLEIGPGVVVSLSGLTITNGVAPPETLYPYWLGGGIYNDHATLTVSNCVVIGNFAGGGAGIANDGSFGSASLEVVNCVVADNSVPLGGDSGGGIINYGESGSANVTLIKSTVRGNNAGLFGGGIFNNGSDGVANCILVNSIMSSNNAAWSGGGVYNAGWNGTASLTLENSSVIGNEADTAGGGGVYNAGYNGTALLTVTNGTFTGNRCLYYARGAALYNGLSSGNALMILANSTISGNSAVAGGGIYNGNDADIAPGFGPGNGFLQILNCTLSDNSAETIYQANCESNATVEIGSTILNADASGSTIGFGCASASNTVTSLGYNLSSDGGGGVLTSATDLVNVDPLLGPLRNNGGPTFTHALLLGSPAIDQGKNFSGLPFDQRGRPFARTFDNPFIPNAPGGDGTDIGAFEVQTASPAQAVQDLLTLVYSRVQQPKLLRVILDAALTSIGRNNPTAAIYDLAAFQQQVRIHIMPSDRALAVVLLQVAQDAISALQSGHHP